MSGRTLTPPKEYEDLAFSLSTYLKPVVPVEDERRRIIILTLRKLYSAHPIAADRFTLTMDALFTARILALRSTFCLPFRTPTVEERHIFHALLTRRSTDTVTTSLSSEDKAFYRTQLWYAVDNLPEVLRPVLLLHLCCAWSLPEVADACNMALPQVEQWYRRAIEAVYKQLRPLSGITG